MSIESVGAACRRAALVVVVATALTGLFASSTFAGHALMVGDNRIHWNDNEPS